MRCGNCGTENRAGAKYCTSCGEPLVSTMKKRRSPLHIILPVVLVVIGLSVFFLLRSLNGVTTLADMKRINGGEMPSFLFNEDEALQFVRGKFTEKGIEDVDAAREAVSELYQSFGIDGANENLELLREDVVFENHFYRFQQECQGIPVYQHEIVLCTDPAGNVSAMSGCYWEGSVETVDPKVQRMDLKVEDGATDYKSEAQLVVLAHTATKGELAWQFTTPTQGYVYSAETGDLLRREELVTSEMRRTRSVSGNVEFDANYENGFYLAEDTSRNIVVFDAKNQDPIDEQQCELHGFSEGAWDREDIALALANAERAYDEYCKLGREGFDGKKGRIRVFVQKGERTGNNTNAGSNPGGLIEYNADNSISLACTLHEYSHMVQRSICRMNYDGSDRDAIMEAYADIMAICILEDSSWEYDGNCRNIANPLDLTTGEEGPHATSYLETDESKGAWIAGAGHHNSTAISHTAYLMYKSGFSFEKLRKLWYLSMYFLDSYANARTCRAAVLSAATLLNCSGSEVQIIEDAFDSVGIGPEGYGLTQSAKIVALNNDKSLHEGFDLTITSINAAQAGVIFSAPKRSRAVWTISTSGSSVRLDRLDESNEKLPEGLYLMTLRDNTGTKICVTKYIQISSETGKDSAEVILATEPKATVEITKIPGKIRNYQNENTVEDSTDGDSDSFVDEGQTRYTLSGVVRVHEEDTGSSMITVVSMTLDEPVDYEFSYRGNPASGTAREVELTFSGSEDFGTWAAYEGRHITVECESLYWAIHDGSYHNVDSFAGGVRLIRADPLPEDSGQQFESPESEPDSDSEPGSVLEQETDPDHDSDAVSEQEPDPDPEPDPYSEPDPDPESDSDSELQADA